MTSGAKPRLLPIFVNKVLLEHRHAHLFTYHLWLLLTTAEMLLDVIETVWLTKSKL